jgi:hypothetical protein
MLPKKKKKEKKVLQPNGVSKSVAHAVVLSCHRDSNSDLFKCYAGALTIMMVSPIDKNGHLKVTLQIVFLS